MSPAPTVEAEAIVEFASDAPPRRRRGDRAGRAWSSSTGASSRPGARLLTEPLADALRDTDGLAVCVLNRRGRFRLLACDACHELLRWDRNAERPLVCPACGEARLRVRARGCDAGAARSSPRSLPGKRVVDVDADTGDVAADADIVVGTEAVLHRADIRRRRPTLVAYLDLDQELLAPRYRAATQALWLVVRGAQLLAGAAARRDAPAAADARSRPRGRARGRRRPARSS